MLSVSDVIASLGLRFCMSSIEITSLGERELVTVLSVWHCDHLTSGRGSWSWCCLSSIVITLLRDEEAGHCAVCLALWSPH